MEGAYWAEQCTQNSGPPGPQDGASCGKWVFACPIKLEELRLGQVDPASDSALARRGVVDTGNDGDGREAVEAKFGYKPRITMDC